MTEIAAQSPQMMEFHADTIQWFKEEFPEDTAKLERLIKDRKIQVIDEQKERKHVNKNV